MSWGGVGGYGCVVVIVIGRGRVNFQTCLPSMYRGIK